MKITTPNSPFFFASKTCFLLSFARVALLSPNCSKLFLPNLKKKTIHDICPKNFQIIQNSSIILTKDPGKENPKREIRDEGKQKSLLEIWKSRTCVLFLASITNSTYHQCKFQKEYDNLIYLFFKKEFNFHLAAAAAASSSSSTILITPQ